MVAARCPSAAGAMVCVLLTRLMLGDIIRVVSNEGGFVPVDPYS